MKKQSTKPTTFKGTPVFEYFSVCCTALATKAPCLKVSKKDAETNSLGTWRCTNCRKAAKVSRRNHQVAEPDNANLVLDTNANGI